MLVRVFALICFVFVVAILSAPAPQGPTGLDRRDSNWIDYMTCLVNKQRATQGLQPLAVDTTLSSIAQAHAQYMQTANSMTHDDPNGSLGARLSRSSISWTGCSENIAAGFDNVNAVFNAWLGSPGHYANIMGASSNIFGAGYDKKYFVNDFAVVSDPSAIGAYIPSCD
ncbi:hypothetical protein EV182_004627 [Spiromyces aspiralis]|uniref:Uncharacterized protein n=1 Tax=Spiromyces aspiralis TaxID=68401 RepID=A0ACC1HNZ3_9FUNG|nr:hypothetical protein EV182_004627 [Spiromyces aspiralis]